MNTAVLKGRMAETGYSQRRLALEIGISPQSLCRKMKGYRQFTVSEAVAICDLLRIPPEQRALIFLP